MATNKNTTKATTRAGAIAKLQAAGLLPKITGTPATHATMQIRLNNMLGLKD